MSYALLWIETLAIWLLWIAAVTASLGRVESRLRRIVWGIPALLLPLLILGGFAAWAIAMPIVAVKELHTHLEHNWSAYAVSLLASFLIGTWMITRASRRREPGMPPQAATWPRGKLWLTLAAAILVANMTLWNMDLAARSQGLVSSIQLDSQIEALTPAVPDDQNAAILYDKAFSRLMSDDSVADVVGSDHFDPKDAATIEMFKRHEQTIVLLRRAAAMPLCRFDRDYVRPDITLLIAETNTFRGAANLLDFDERRQLAEGNIDLAMDDVKSLYAMSRHVARDPMLISVMVAFGIDALANKALARSLPSATRSGQLAGINIDDAWARWALRRALITEQGYGTAVISDWMSNGFSTDSHNSEPAPVLQRTVHSGDNPLTMLLAVFWLSDEASAYRDLVAQYRWMTLQPFFKIEPRLAGMGDIPGGIFSSILVKSLGRNLNTAARIEAMDGSASVGVALATYRLDHGKMPAQLSDLVPAYLDEIPDDPFNGKPLQLSVKDGDWFIFSIEKAGDYKDAENIGFHFHPR